MVSPRSAPEQTLHDGRVSSRCSMANPQRQPSRLKKDMQLRAGMVVIPVHQFGDHRNDRAPADDETNPSTMRSASAHDFRASARLSLYVSTEENKEGRLRRGSIDIAPAPCTNCHHLWLCNEIQHLVIIREVLIGCVSCNRWFRELCDI